MAEMRSEIEIAATPARVWEILTDFDRYGEWNPFIPSIAGELREGAELEVVLRPSGMRAMTIRPTMQRVVSEREFRWLGSMGMKGLFDGEHAFIIEPLATGGVRFIQSETFKGLFVSGVLAMVGPGTQRGFDAMSSALKTRAEVK